MRNLLDFNIEPDDGLTFDDNNILVRKGNQLHELLLYLIFIYAIVFTLMNLYMGERLQAVISFCSLPGSLLALLLFKRGYINLSKIWNLCQIVTVVGLLSLTSDPESAVLAFFIPITTSTLIVFQGKDRKYGYWLTIATGFVFVWLLTTDLHFENANYTPERPVMDRTLNLFGTGLATVMEIVFILQLSNRIQTHLIARNEELKKANGELDRFVYSVSHDLRSPLLTVKGLLSLIFTIPARSEKMDEYLQLADKSINRLDDTIREILDYSRNARLEVDREPVNMRELVEGVYAELNPAVGDGFKFSVEIKGEDTLSADRVRLSMVFRNLIGNAVKYRRQNIEDPWARFTMRREAQQVVMTVEDNGEGIKDTHLPKVFDMFYRATSTGVGTGLGLYICREVVGKLGGTIDIYSVERAGTKVTVVLPA